MTKKEQRAERAHDLTNTITLELCGDALLKALFAFRKAYGEAYPNEYERDFEKLRELHQAVADTTHVCFLRKHALMQEMAE